MGEALVDDGVVARLNAEIFPVPRVDPQEIKFDRG